MLTSTYFITSFFFFTLCYPILTLSNDALRPVRLERHIHSVHPNLKDRSKAFFQTKLSTTKKMKLDSTGVFAQQNQKLVEASYDIALLIAREKKPHTIGETLVKPCILSSVQKVIGDEESNKLKQMSLSDKNVKRRNDDMAADVKTQLISLLHKFTYFSLQCDESTDVSQCAQLMVYCRFINENKLCEELLFCKKLEETYKGSDVFKLMDDFLEENNLNWESVAGISTDGAPAMLGFISGFFTSKTKKSKVNWDTLYDT